MSLGIQVQSAVIAAVLLLAVGINVALQERRVLHRGAFLFFIGGFFFYNVALVMDALMGGPVLRRVFLLSGLAVCQGSLNFFDRYLNRASTGALRSLVTAGTVTALVLTLTQLGDAPLSAWLVSGLALAGFGHGVWQLWLRQRAASGTAEGRRLSYLVWGGVGVASLGSLDLLAIAGLPVPAVGHVAQTVYIYFWMQVVQRSRLLDLKELMGRGLALLIHALVFSMVFVALVFWVGEQVGLFFYNTLVASVVVIVLYEPVRRLVNHWTSRLVHRERHELDLHVRALRGQLAGLVNLGALVEALLKGLEASRRVTHASVFLMDSAGQHLVLQRAVGPVSRRKVSVASDRAFLSALHAERVLTAEHVRRALLDQEAGTPVATRLEQVQETMLALSAGLCFPLRSGERLLGLLCLDDESLGEGFSSSEITLLSGLAAQLTAAIESSEVHERLAERDRLSVIGEMATGMAHEIRNPLSAIKAAVQLLEPEEMEEEQRDFVGVILEETSRLDHVLTQFLDYARPYRGSLQPVALGRVLERVATLVRADAVGLGVTVELKLQPELPQVMGDADRLAQVCLNLARNGAEAMEEMGGGTLVLEARLKTPEGWVPLKPRPAEASLEILVKDSGPGLSPEARRNLFVPFFTTKGKGTGLGLAITQRILATHGSTLRVDSAEGEGTTMSFILPLAAGDP